MPITLQPHNFTINGLGGVLDSRVPSGVQPNRPPVVAAIPAQSALPGQSFSIASYGSDPDSDALTWSREGGTAPAGVTINASGSVTVGAGVAPGQYTVGYKADDGKNDAESDWIARSTGPGVVWAHDFRLEREVAQFRVSDNVAPYATTRVGNDPNNVGVNTIHWDQTDGIGNSRCLRTVAPNGMSGFPAGSWWENVSSATSRVHFPAGTTYTATNSTSGVFTFPGGATFNFVWSGTGEAPTNTTALFDGERLKYEGRVSAGGWARPFSALIAGNSGNGLPAPDRAGGGEPLRTFDPSNRLAFQGFRAGYYGPADLHSAVGGGSSAADWDGTEFYLQFRVKLSSGRHAKRTPPAGANADNAAVGTWLRDGQTYEFLPAGKLAFIQPGPEQLDGYVILQSGAYQRYAYETAPLRMYSYRGNLPLQDPQTGGSPTIYQNGADYAPTCHSVGDIWSAGACWEWPEDEWVTVLFYMKPGHDNVGQGSNQALWTHKDTHVRVWVARRGASQYTEIFNKADLAFNWDGSTSTTPAGSINNVDFSCYMNNLPAWAQFEQKYTQVIFSKQFIPCPGAQA